MNKMHSILILFLTTEKSIAQSHKIIKRTAPEQQNIQQKFRKHRKTKLTGASSVFIYGDRSDLCLSHF